MYMEQKIFLIEQTASYNIIPHTMFIITITNKHKHDTYCATYIIFQCRYVTYNCYYPFIRYGIKVQQINIIINIGTKCRFTNHAGCNNINYSITEFALNRGTERRRLLYPRRYVDWQPYDIMFITTMEQEHKILQYKYYTTLENI